MSHQIVHASNDLLVSGISNASAQLGLSFMKDLSKNRKDNVVISPISLQIILNMILLGAKFESRTEQELIKFLGYEELYNKQMPSDKSEPHVAMNRVSELLTNSVATSSGLKFDLANLILAGKKPNPDYSKAVDKFYRNTKWEQFSASTDAKKLLQRVNNWVSEATKHQITNLDVDLDPKNLMMILVNAAYFQGEWLHKFSVEQTSEKSFYNHGLENQATKVKFMQRTGSFKMSDLTAVVKSEAAPDVILSKSESEFLKLAGRLDCRVLSMPFSANKGNELDMVILLPNKRDGLHGLLDNLTASDLKEILKEVDGERPTKTQVEIPKFSFETTYNVKTAMRGLGVSEVFSDSAKLDRMFEAPPVQVDEILHKAKISVDEKGAEAAAVTLATVTMRSGSWPLRQPFKADRPFLFLIRHLSSGMPIFLGSVVRL